MSTVLLHPTAYRTATDEQLVDLVRSGTTAPSTRSTTATRRAWSPSPASSWAARTTTPRRSSRTRSSARWPRCAPTTARWRCAPGSSRSCATARWTRCAAPRDDRHRAARHGPARRLGRPARPHRAARGARRPGRAACAPARAPARGARDARAGRRLARDDRAAAARVAGRLEGAGLAGAHGPRARPRRGLGAARLRRAAALCSTSSATARSRPGRAAGARRRSCSARGGCGGRGHGQPRGDPRLQGLTSIPPTAARPAVHVAFLDLAGAPAGRAGGQRRPGGGGRPGAGRPSTAASATTSARTSRSACPARPARLGLHRQRRRARAAGRRPAGGHGRW